MTAASQSRGHGVLRVGDRVRYGGVEQVVTGLSGTLVRLLSDGGAESVVAVVQLQGAADFALLTEAGTPSLPGLGLLACMPAGALERARWWEAHILEVETGRRPHDPDAPPLAAYDPARTSLEEREAAKADELTAAGQKVSRRTLRRYRSVYAASGLWGLVDQRAVRAPSPTGRVDSRVVQAARQAMAEQVAQSTGTRARVLRRMEAILAAEFGAAAVSLPSQATLYRLLAALETGRHTFGPATTRRSLANRPDGPFGTMLAARPGELVQIDTTPLDVLALLDDGVSGRVELTMLVDLATRTICSGVLRPHGTKAVDAALLLARALVPEPMRPGWAEALRMRYSRLPHTELTAVDARLADAAAKPVIVPETIVCDRGSVFVSETFLSACARLGISLQPAHPRTPTDKGVVERTFSSINTLFCQYVAGYTGRDPTRRGADVQAVWTLAQLQDLFDQWVLAGWQPRPHDGLRHPELARAALSPNEMYAAQVAAAGYLPLALTGSDYLELLPVAWRQITAEGIRLGSLTYDCTGLNPHRGQPSPHPGRRGQWPVHHDPYDLGQVWIRRPDRDPGEVAGAAEWIEVPWIHRGRTPAPFADFTLRHTRRVLAARGEHDQLAVATALDALLSTAEAGPTPPPDRPARRIAAKTRAAASVRILPNAAPTSDHDDGEAAGVDVDEPQRSDRGAVVVPFGVFDPHAEARRFW